MKIKLKLFYSLIFLILAISSIRLLELNKNEKFLNIFARYYFDENYYLEHYPDVKEQHVAPFNHYVTCGWKEGRNPSKSFETGFYVRQYLSYTNKYNLNPLADYVKSKVSFEQKRMINHKQMLKAKLLQDPKYYISLVAVFQNEARFLREWIEFYLLMGVEHFYLYNHLSSDDYMEILDPYIKNGIVELKDVKENPKNIQEWNSLQTKLYTETSWKVKDLSEWLIVVDTDEFLFPIKAKNLKEILKKYDDYAALSVNWKMFGSGDVEKIEPDKLLIESLTKSSNDQDLHVKTIVKPRYVKDFTNPHFANFLPCYSQVTENFEYFNGPFIPTESRNILRINYYWARDFQFFKSQKLNRIHIADAELTDDEKKVKVNHLIEINKNISANYDDSILRFAKDLKYNLFK
jgi:hypothetical protein